MLTDSISAELKPFGVIRGSRNNKSKNAMNNKLYPILNLFL